MAYQLVHDGVLREFQFYAPIGWEYWHERAFTEDGRRGLPMVIALHGGGQDPASFAADWPFPLLINSAASTNWEDRFFVLYPYGFGYTTDLAGVPVRGWNTGFSGDFLRVQSDVSFIHAAMQAVERMLDQRLAELQVGRPAVDADRRYLFGYSMGGMMSYKLARELPDTFAALWVMSGAIGGRSSEGYTATVTNVPLGRSTASLFAHHGEMDDVVPPGPRQDVSGRQSGTHPPDLYLLSGMPAAEIPLRRNSVRHLAAAIASYKLYNDCEDAAYFTTTATDGSSLAAPDVGGTSTAVKLVFRQAGNAVNPEVIVYRDPLMEHTGFTSAGPNRYFNEADAWSFFKLHPRVTL
jgi:poly(3-hydroxybutyrate) depolymerase